MNKRKLLSVIILTIIATLNAAYLTHMAYGQLNGPSFCDISATMSCTSVFNNTASQIFGIPFPAIALVVYPVLFLIALWWYLNKISRSQQALRRLSLGGFLFNSYFIYQEAFVIKAFCPLCLLCTGIIITIHILTYGKPTLPQEIIEA